MRYPGRTNVETWTKKEAGETRKKTASSKADGTTAAVQGTHEENKH